MKIIVTHNSPDLDAVTSAWLIKRFLPGWNDAQVITVPAGSRINTDRASTDVIEHLDGKEVIHVDTGLGPLDHHETQDDNICAASRTLDYILENSDIKDNEHKKESLRRLIEYVVDDDHFQEVFYPNPSSDMYEFNVVSALSGIKVQYPRDDETCLRLGFDLMDAILHSMENRVWAEEEIKNKGIRFTTRWGKGIAIETMNDEVLKLSQLFGYAIAVRRDPKTGTVRIKARPAKRMRNVGEILSEIRAEEGSKKSLFHYLSGVDIDLTPVYERLKAMDPAASWFLHVSKRMLLNGSTKNPNMKGSKLTLSEVVEVLQNI